jgi:hypothetical protein
MMPTGRLNEDRFDRLLAGALQKHSEPVPADFTERMLSAIQQAQHQRILAGIAFQQRLALAASIVLGACAVLAAVFFPAATTEVFRSITGSVMERADMWFGKIPQTIETIRNQWQSYAVLTAVFGFAIYSLVELLLGDRLRIA